MKKISLARAFVIRKRMKSELDSLYNALLYADLRYDFAEYEQYSDKETEIKNNYSDVFNKFEALTALFSNFNTEIDLANAKGPRAILNQIEVSKRKQNLYRQLSNNQSNLKLKETVWDNYKFNEKTQSFGDNKEILYGAITDVNYTNLYEASIKATQKLEDDLADINSQTFIELNDDMVQGLISFGFIS